MGQVGKKFKKAKEMVAGRPEYPLAEAVAAVAKAAFAKFDETVEVAVRLGVDPARTAVLPPGTDLDRFPDLEPVAARARAALPERATVGRTPQRCTGASAGPAALPQGRPMRLRPPR